MRIALDTNVIVYAEGANDPKRQTRAKAVIRALPPTSVVVPAQALGELFRVLTGKARWPTPRALAVVQEWRIAYIVAPTTSQTLASALDLAADHRLSIWDAVILAAAAEADCRLMLSEDMGDGFAWRGLTVVNPLAVKPNPLLAMVLGN